MQSASDVSALDVSFETFKKYITEDISFDQVTEDVYINDGQRAMAIVNGVRQKFF